MALWAIVARGTGELLCPCFATEGAQHPKDAGWAWDPTAQDAVELAGRPDLVAEKWDAATRAFAPDVERVTAELRARIDGERERRKMTALTRGSAMATTYASKAREVEGWYTLGTTPALILGAFNLLPAAAKMRRFPFAVTEAAVRGVPIAQVVAGFEQGHAASIAKVARYEAVARRAIIAFDGAPTLAAKRAVVDGIDWEGN